jgi:adhesin/invasin
LRYAENVTATIGGQTAQVAFAGMAPGFAGLMQINIVVPEGVTPGDSVPLQIAVNGVASQAGTVISVR